MSQNKRNVDTDQLAKPSQGNASPTGTGTHDRHRVEAEDAAEDHTAQGTAGSEEGYGKGNTRP